MEGYATQNLLELEDRFDGCLIEIGADIVRVFFKAAASTGAIIL